MDGVVGYAIPVAEIGFGILILSAIAALFWRVVVPTNDVHIVQSAKSTVSYGKDQTAGNVYYDWPAWLPLVGVQTIKLPVSVFDLHLQDYAAYDKGRVPFVVDIMAFFRITDSNVAAQRVSNMKDLNNQLDGILKSAARAILATSEIEEILEGRAQFGVKFTEEVNRELVQWGIQTVKNIEFMDIRDANGSQVIANIMAKKKSLIEMESRVAVATNVKTAQMAEIDAQRQVKIQEQDALEQIGVRTAQKERQIGMSNADKDQQIGIATEQAAQAVKEQKRVTAEKDMAIQSVQRVKAAEIERDVQVVAAGQVAQVAVVEAEGQKKKTVLTAEGALEAAKRAAEGIQVNGIAKAEAEKALQLAPVTAQITLAKEIGANEGYQKYLISVRQIEANQIVGVEQAKAMEASEIKIVATTGGSPSDGIKDVASLFSAGGGAKLGAAIEAFGQTEVGAAIINRVTGSNGAAHR